MARINIDTGTLGNPATGDTLRTAMTKINTNFAEVYSLVQDGSSGLIATDVTNGDLKLQANGTGTIEIDQLSISGDSITTIATNGSVDITGNGTGGVNIEALNFSGTSISSADSSSINLNENVDIDGDLNVTGNITGTFSVSAIGDVTAVGSTLTAPSNADLTLTTSGTGVVAIDNLTVDSNINITDNEIKATASNSDLILSPSGTGSVVIAKADINSGNIDNTIIGAGTPAAGTFTTITANTSASIDGVTISDNTITSSASNANLELSAAGSGEVTTDTNFKLISGTPFLKIQRTDNANVPGIDFLGQAGTSGAKILFDGTSGTANELIFQTFTVAGGIAEAFRVTGTGAKVTGALEIDDGLTIDGSIITAPSNADIVLNAGGTGSVDIEGIQIKGTEISSSDSTQVTIKENLHVTGNITGTITGTINADSSTVSNLEVDNFKASAIVTEGEGIGSNDNDTTIPTSAAVKDYVDNNAGGTTGDLAITGSTISAPSNADLTLNAGGTGSVDIEGIQIKGTEISSTDSTQVTIKENLHVTGNITGTINANQLSGALPAISGGNLTGVAKHAFKTVLIGGGNSLVADDAVDTLTINPGNNVTITDDDSLDSFTINVNGMGDLTFVGSTILSPSNADITLSPGGTGSVAMPGVTITDNKITSNRSNDNLELAASGTGSVSVDGIQIKGTELSSSDSTQITIKENLHVTGTLSVAGSTLSGTLNTAGNTGTGSVALASESLQVTGTTNEINVDAAAFALSLSLADDISGIVSVTASSFLANDAIKIVDNQITGLRSNEDIQIDPAGTGGIVAQGPVTFNAGYIEKINTLTSSSTITVDCSAASIHKVTLGVSTEFNISNLPTGGTVTLIITQDGSGSRTATFGTDGSTAVKFPGGAPTLSTGAGDIDVVTIVNDGTNFLGNCAKDYS